MIKRLKHQRIQVPNSLAIIAATVLVGSSIIGFESNQGPYTNGSQDSQVVQADNAGTDSINRAAENKSRRFNIGSLLFRRK